MQLMKIIEENKEEVNETFTIEKEDEEKEEENSKNEDEKKDDEAEGQSSNA